MKIENINIFFDLDHTLGISKKIRINFWKFLRKIIQ
jgi:RNase P/RNase MRP subunit p30